MFLKAAAAGAMYKDAMHWAAGENTRTVIDLMESLEAHGLRYTDEGQWVARDQTNEAEG
jgi:hypothetical protein